MFDNYDWMIPSSLIAILLCIAAALPILYFSEKADIANLVSRCESRGGTVLKNTYRVGNSSSTSWVCVKPDIIIEL